MYFNWSISDIISFLYLLLYNSHLSQVQERDRQKVIIRFQKLSYKDIPKFDLTTTYPQMCKI